MNAAFLSSYGYRAVTITDAFSTSSSTPSTTTTSPKTTSASATVTGPTGINTAILNSYGGTTTGTETGRSSAGGGLGSAGLASKSKSAEAPRVTGAMRMIAAVAVIGGAVGWEV